MAKRKTTTSSNGNGLLSLPVAFGDVSVGDKTARIGATIDRSTLALDKADGVLCGKRLTVALVLTNGENPDQAKMPGFEDDQPKMQGVADVKRLGISAKHISCGFTFALESIPLETLCHFAKRQARLTVEHTEPIPDEDGGDEDEDVFDREQAEQPAKRGRRQKGGEDPKAWRSLDLGVLELNDQTKHALTEAGLSTLGELTDYRAKGVSFASVKNIGPKKAAVVEKAVADYFQRVKVTRQLLGQTAEAVAAPE